jgi:hypothetical protein
MHQRRRSGGVADPHFAQAEQIETLLRLLQAGFEGLDEFQLRQCRFDREVAGGAIEIERAHLQLHAEGLAELIHRGTSGVEVLDHLRGDRGRVGRHAVRDDAVVGGEDARGNALQPRRMAALPGGEPFRKLFQAAERPVRLGQRAFASADTADGLGIRFGKIG